MRNVEKYPITQRAMLVNPVPRDLSSGEFLSTRTSAHLAAIVVMSSLLPRLIVTSHLSAVNSTHKQLVDFFCVGGTRHYRVRVQFVLTWLQST